MFERLRDRASQVPPLEALIAADPSRAGWLSVDACGVHLDLTRVHIDAALFGDLLGLVRGVGVRDRFTRMFDGDFINTTEGRRVLHVACRGSGGATDAIDLARAQRERAMALAESVRADADVDCVVNIGIGGSDLGPQMMVKALRRWCDGPRVRFVSNVDPADLDAALADLDPGRTMFIVSSKTFTTLETMMNAERARLWLTRAGVDWPGRFIASTARPDLAIEWGIPGPRCLEFHDWVGGRYSLSSVIGLPVMIAAGPAVFDEMLAGMRAMDEHVSGAPEHGNIAVLHALAWFTNAVLRGHPTVAVVPYGHDLARLPAHLQQLVMESNGKSVDIDGRALAHPGAPVVWGEPGTNGQHAFFQMIHQGTQVVPVEFVSTVAPMGTDAAAHGALVANMFAQAEALAAGAKGVSSHRDFPGDRPSSVVMLDALSPSTMGALVAMYEHSTAVQGWLTGVNSFDQFGVELGKSIASGIIDELRAGSPGDSETLTHPLRKWFVEKRAGNSAD